MNCVCLCKAVNRSPSNKDTCIGNQYIWLIYWQYIDNNFAGDIKKQTLLIFILLFILVLQLSMSVNIEMIHNVRLFLKKKVSYVHQGYMYLIKKYCKIVLLWNIIAKKKWIGILKILKHHLFLYWQGRIFSSHNSCLQCHVIL